MPTEEVEVRVEPPERSGSNSILMDDDRLNTSDDMNVTDTIFSGVIVVTPAVPASRVACRLVCTSKIMASDLCQVTLPLA